MNNNIMVSICCTTYNHEKYIEEAIKSFLMQKVNFKFEILIHDDASTDNTANIIRKYEEKYPNLIKPIYQKENQYSKGISVSKILYEKAQGKYIAICEGDDYWTDPYKLQKQIDYMEANPKCGLCSHAVEKYDEKLKKVVGIIKPYEKDQKIIMKDLILVGMLIATDSVVVRKENLKFPKFYLECIVGDFPFNIIHATQDYGYFFSEVMSAYRINTGTSWVDKNTKGYENDRKLKMSLIKMLEGFNQWTNFKYKKEVKIKIEKMSYKVLKYYWNGNINLSQEEYEYLLKNLKLTRKIKMYFKFLFRNLKK